MSSYKASQVPEASIVKLRDGRIGYMAHNTPCGRPWVILSDGKGVEIRKSTIIEVLVFPFELAKQWLKKHTAADGLD